MDYRRSGLGVVIRDSHGSLVAGSCVSGSASSVLEAEAKAAILAMQTAISRNLDNVLFESDSASLVQYINGDKKKVSWSIFQLLRRIWNLHHRFHFFKWCWVPRQVNSAANWVASHCRRGMCPEVWVSRTPSALVHILSIDGLPCPQ
ncbi:uncharacterized protein [Malus domestica]|uniref:uncharacterized protein n=1 Tax=Malus domestica TaxID=3750 RepID=UPI0010AB3AEE|nr:uncharacterized protein LOC114820367 [Malus domestica]